MKKSFPLTSLNHKPARVVESVKADIRKYLKRERRKTLPEDVDFWDFDCRAGKDSETAESVHVSEITKPVDTAAQEGWESVYIEILAKEGHRVSNQETTDEKSATKDDSCEDTTSQE